MSLRQTLLSIDWPTGYRKIIIDEVDSTMKEARRRQQYINQPTWILAKNQTKAHGRRGRVWSNPNGNFSATLGLKLSGDPANLALRSFVTALALFDTLAYITKASKLLSLKWPNDVLMEDKKVAGILLESFGSGKITDFLLIGVGVNLVPLPDGIEPSFGGMVRPTSLSDFGFKINPEDFLVYLAANFDYWEKQLRSSGFSELRKVWLSRAIKIGEMITVRTGLDLYEGIFDTIDDSGNLVLKMDCGIKVIPAGDVYF